MAPYLVDLADALVVAGEHAREVGDLVHAQQYLDEAIGLAGARGLVPTQNAGLAAQARGYAARYRLTGDDADLFRGRDVADVALRLATGPDSLPWAELDACRAHALLDRAEAMDRGWATRADALYARLVPSGLEADPLRGVEHEIGHDPFRRHPGDVDF